VPGRGPFLYFRFYDKLTWDWLIRVVEDSRVEIFNHPIEFIQVVC